VGGHAEQHMKRRKFIIGTCALASGSAAAVGSGAFTSVQADRSVTVDVTGDDSALLAMKSCDGPNGEYATMNGVDGDNPNAIAEIGDDYQFTLEIPNLNGKAFTRIDNVFKIINQGTQSVVVYIQEFGANTAEIDIGVRDNQIDTDRTEGDTGEGIDGADVFDASSPTAPDPNKLSQIGIQIGQGKSVKLGMYADTSNGSVNDGLGEAGGNPTTGDGVELWNKLEISASAERADYAYDAN